MTKEQIAAQIKEWIGDGKLFTRASVKNYYSLYKKMSAGEYIMTKNQSVFTGDKGTADAFNSLVEKRLVLSFKDIIGEGRITNRHRLDAACARGELLKLRIQGVSFYIRDECHEGGYGEE